MSGKKVLITGASGFLGKNLLTYLKDHGYKNFILLDRVMLSNLDISFFLSVDTVIHLAGKAHDLKSTSQSQDYYDVNYELTKNLFDFFLVSDAKKFIFISSVKAVTDSVEGVLTEDVIPNPQTDYGKSKLLAENYIQEQSVPEGKSFYILRPCMIHGAGNKGNLNLLFNFVRRGMPYPLAGFKNSRSFLSVYNMCFIITKLIERETLFTGIYNVSDDEALSTNDVVTILSEAMGSRPRFWYVKESLIRSIAKVCDHLKLPLTTERLNKLTENYIVSNIKIRNALKCELPKSAREGLKETALSFIGTLQEIKEK